MNPERTKKFAMILPNNPRALFGVFLVLGWGLREAAIAWRLRRHGLVTEGFVVEHVRYTRSDGAPEWAPVVAFTDCAGNRVEFSPQAQGAGLGMSNGRTVPVIYLPEAASSARVNTWQHLLLPALLAHVAGLMVIGIVAVLASMPLWAW